MSEQLPLLARSAFGYREAFWRLSRCWLTRGWWLEERPLPPCVAGAPTGKPR